MKNKGRFFSVLWAVLTGLCLILSAFLKFAMVGFSFSAFLFLCAGVLFSAFFLISAFERVMPRPARIVRNIIIVILIFGAAMFIAAEIPVILASGGDSDNAAEYLIVLGAGINGTSPSLSMINRLVAAFDYLSRYPESTAVLTGGQGPGESIPEAEAMRIWLERQGIAPGRLLIEDESTSTLENIVFALEIIESDAGDITKPIAIASSEYHLYRAKYIASSLGITTLGVSAKTKNFPMKINHFIREAFGVIYMWVFGVTAGL